MRGYFFTADLLGFKNITQNLDHQNLISKVERWISLVETEISTTSISMYKFFSDSLFIGSNDSAEDLKNLIDLGRVLLEKGVSSNLPIKGAISFGEYEWGTSVFGTAVLKAYELEQNQNWIGITCDTGSRDIDALWGIGQVICYPPPMKQNGIRLYPVIDWEVPRFNDLIKLLLRDGLTKPEEVLNWEWAEKLSNTIEFGLYRRLLIKEKGTPNQFHGFLPIHAIESLLDQ